MNKLTEYYAKKKKLIIKIASALAVLSIFLISGMVKAQPNPQHSGKHEIIGNIFDTQNNPVDEAVIKAYAPGSEEALAETESNADGTWTLALRDIPEELMITIQRPHFKETSFTLKEPDLQSLQDYGSLLVDDNILDRKVDASFWVAVLVFFAVLLLIAFEVLHSTTASLAAMSAIFLVSYIGGALSPNWYIFNFERALTYINWEVIFLVMGMMIVIAMIESTGLFQWTAFQAYRLSGGRGWLLVLILMSVTAIASALLDNFTTMLLMTPISIQIALALGMNPIALVIPEILASNVGGISTLIGTPTNIIIGAYANIGFSDFLINQTVGVLIALAAMGAFVVFYYRKEFIGQQQGISDKLYELLQERGQIRDRDTLWKSGVVFILVLVGFVLGEKIHIPPAVPALAGAAFLFVWLRPDVSQTIEAVDWTTMVFFMSLFIVVGAIQEVGFISMVADLIKRIVGENLVLAIIMIALGAGTLSTGIANIPLAASMLPVVEFLSGSIPGASNKVLYYALSMGAAMGGNGFLIGGEANLVTAGITEQAGQPISFKEFMKIGLPVTYLTLTIGILWLILRFVVFA